jgi:hypothetical protein
MIDPWASSTLEAAASNNARIAGTIKFGKKSRMLAGAIFFLFCSCRTHPNPASISIKRA